MAPYLCRLQESETLITEHSEGTPEHRLSSSSFRRRRHAPIYSAEKKGERGGEGGSSTKGRRRGRQRGFCSLLPPSRLIMRPRPRSPAIESRNKITPRLRWHGRARAPFTTFAPRVSPSSPYSAATKKRQERKGEKRYKGRGSYNYCRVPSEPTGLDYRRPHSPSRVPWFLSM